MFSSTSFIVLHFIFRFIIYFEVIFVKGIKSVYTLIFFAYGCPIVQTIFVEKTIISPLNCFCTFVNNQLTIFVIFYFWVLYSVPSSYVSIILLMPSCLITCFIVSIEIWWCEFSNFILLFQFCVGYYMLRSVSLTLIIFF